MLRRVGGEEAAEEEELNLEYCHIGEIWKKNELSCTAMYLSKLVWKNPARLTVSFILRVGSHILKLTHSQNMNDVVTFECVGKTSSLQTRETGIVRVLQSNIFF